MFRKSMLYRRLWYIKKRNIKKINSFVRLVIIIILLCPLLLYAGDSMLSITGAVYGINPERLVKEETARYITAVFNGFEYGAFIQITGDDIHQGVSVLTDRVITTGMQKKIEDELAERIQYALDKNCPILKTREVNTNIIVDMKKLRRDEIILSIGVSVEISVTPKKAVGLCTAKITTWFPLHETVYRKQI